MELNDSNRKIMLARSSNLTCSRTWIFVSTSFPRETALWLNFWPSKILGILGRKLPELFASSMTISSVFIAFLLSCLTLNETLNGLVLNQTIYQWLLTGHYQFEVGFLIDNLTAMMMVVVTFVSSTKYKSQLN